jgi:CRP-like cAMP-binding protein
MMERTLVLDALRRSPLFAGLSREALREVSAALITQSWPLRRQIIGRSDTTGRFFLVVEGRVKISRSNAHDGRDLTLWLLGPGDGFDIVSLLDGRPHDVSAWALDEVTTLSAPMAQWRDWLERFPAFRLAVHRYVACQLREVSELASDLALHDTATRLAHLLLRHFDGPEPNLLHDLPQSELASMIGTVRIVVSRVLAAMKREAIVDLRGGRIRISDLKRLLLRAERHLRSREREESGRDGRMKG